MTEIFKRDTELRIMFGKNFEMNEDTLTVVEEIGKHMPGGFFIYRAQGNEELIYANHVVMDIFGCRDIEEFRELTGFTFRGMIHPDDYDNVRASIDKQIQSSDSNLDYVEYRIIRKDGSVRWVDDYGHRAETDSYGGISYVFISDITEKKERIDSDLAVRQSVIESLIDSYNTVFLIRDVETETFSLYRGDTENATVHSDPISDALDRMKYTQAKNYYVQTTVAAADRERINDELELSNIVSRLETRKQTKSTYLRLMPDGSERYYCVEFTKIDMQGGKTGVFCGFTDVDEEVREEQAANEAIRNAEQIEKENRRLMDEVQSAAKLADFMGSVASLLTNMPAMSFSKDANTGKYLACNQSFAEYAHKNSPEGVVGLTDAEIFDPVTAQHFIEDDKKALAMDEAYLFFEDVPDAVGNMRSFQTTKTKFYDDEGRLCLLGMCVDVTEMTRIKSNEAESRVKQQELEHRIELQEQLLAESRHREQQEKLIAALAANYWSVYYLELDYNHGICYQQHSDVDDGFEVGEEFPYPEAFESYAERYVTDQYKDEFLEFIQPDNIRKGLDTEAVISYRYMVHRHGRDSYEMLSFAGVRHPEDRDDHIVHNVGASFVDVDSETRKQLVQSQALSDALEVAEEANKAKTAFLSNMSHEIRTPMNAIIGLNNIALNSGEATPKITEYLEKTNTSAQHLLNIINDILDMSRIESGRMVIKNEEFSFSGMLDQINTMISGQCRDKNIEYECRIAGNLDGYYIGDDMKLRQVLINILGNAVKFTPEGGKVEFIIEELTRYDNKVTMRYTIKDNGIGMSKEYLPKLFDAFSQENVSAGNKLGSTGLGMPITKSIVELMNGTIDVESEKGKGTTFTVVITLQESDHVVTSLDGEDVQPHEIHVLVIDDDDVACEHANIVLGQAGISCDTALTGIEGIRLIETRHARREPYDLVLVDWKMPELDGIETTRRIREAVGYEMPVIILTSYNWEDVADEAREAGVDSFVRKPLFASTVMEEFRRAFKVRSSKQEKEAADLTGKRILLAEDMALNAEIIQMILSIRDVEVEHAENGQIAVDMFAEHEPGYYDAILMDMRMPVMNGLEASKLIREMDRPDAAEIPIIALTANAFDEDVQRSMQAGLNAHLSKPVEADILYKTLESLIPV